MSNDIDDHDDYEDLDEIEIDVDLEQSASQIRWRYAGQGAWQSTPFQRADVRDEVHALRLVKNWLDAA